MAISAEGTPISHMADQDWEKLEPESAYVKKVLFKACGKPVEPCGSTM
jgi:hypothetical protein